MLSSWRRVFLALLCLDLVADCIAREPTSTTTSSSSTSSRRVSSLTTSFRSLFESSLTTNTTSTSNSNSKDDPTFHPLNCDPCIRRSDYRIKIITHGTKDSSFWWNVRAAAMQAAKDMGMASSNVEMELYDPLKFSGPRMAKDILQAAGVFPATSTDGTTTFQNWDALIVTIYDVHVQEAIQRITSSSATNTNINNNNIIPIFAMNVGFDVAGQLGVMGYVGQDEYKAGQVAAREFLRFLGADTTTITNLTELNHKDGDPNNASTVTEPPATTTTTTTKQRISRALFVNHEKGNPALEARLRGYNDTLQQQSSVGASSRDNASVLVDELVVSRLEVFDLVTQLNDAFEGCPYDVVLLGGSSALEMAIKAMKNNNCTSSNATTPTTAINDNKSMMILGSFDEDASTLEAIAEGNLLFTISQQQYLKGVMPVLLATLHVTTRMKLIPDEQSKVFESGPVIIHRDNLPSDTQKTCTADAFPVCPQTMVPDGSKVSDCNCFDRSKIRIGGVLHGLRTWKFWDEIYSAAETAATDMGIELDMVRFEVQDSLELVHTKMAARIKSLCESGVNGIFVSIPSDVVMKAVRDECQALNIPVVSVNAGSNVSQALGLAHHIGMFEYSAGYAAGKRLIEEGLQVGYCLNHGPGFSNLEQRCKGFEAAIVESGNTSVVYGGSIDVINDNAALYAKAVIDAVESNTADWTGVGLLILGTGTLSAAWQILEGHPGVLLGTFDVGDEVIQGLADGKLLWGIDQQAYLQGAMPVYLLAYEAYTNQLLTNHALQTGPSFVERPPSDQERFCKANFFHVCPTRPSQDFNYISEGWIIAGYALWGINLTLALASLFWMAIYMKTSSIVQASQPLFLSLVIFGAIMSSFSIVTMGIQTEYPYLEDNKASENPELQRTNAACMASWWLYSIGFGLMFSALFAKIWRVKMIFDAGKSFRRIIVNSHDVASVLVFMMGVEIVILLTWQLVSPEHWEREILRESQDGFAVESVGQCTSDKGGYFKTVIIVFHLLSLLYALILCFQTKHLNSDFAETSYISLAVVCMFQILVIAVPIYIMVEEDSNIYYFVRACVVFLQNFTVICLIFAPKMLRVHQGRDATVLTRNAVSRQNLAVNSFLSSPSSRASNRISLGSCHDLPEDAGPNPWSAREASTCDSCGRPLTCRACGSVKFLECSKKYDDVSSLILSTEKGLDLPLDDDDNIPPFDGDKGNESETDK